MDYSHIAQELVAEIDELKRQLERAQTKNAKLRDLLRRSRKRRQRLKQAQETIQKLQACIAQLENALIKARQVEANLMGRENLDRGDAILTADFSPVAAVVWAAVMSRICKYWEDRSFCGECGRGFICDPVRTLLEK